MGSVPRINRNQQDAKLRRLSQTLYQRDTNIIIGSSVISGGTNGSILFVGSGGVISQDNAKFFYDDTADQLLLGGTTAATSAIVLDAGGNAVFNEQGADKDLRVEGDTDVNLIFVDASADKVGIGTSGPGEKLEVQGHIKLNRLKPTVGTAIQVTDVTLSGTWGASAVVTSVTGNDSRGTITVTTDAADTPGANPTVTLTFKDGTWTTVPFAVSGMDGASTGPAAPVTTSPTAATLVLTYVGTPTATSALTYVFSYMVQG